MSADKQMRQDNDTTEEETGQLMPRRKARMGYEEFQKPNIVWLSVKTVPSAGCLAISGMSSVNQGGRKEFEGMLSMSR